MMVPLPFAVETIRRQIGPRVLMSVGARSYEFVENPPALQMRVGPSRPAYTLRVELDMRTDTYRVTLTKRGRIVESVDDVYADMLPQVVIRLESEHLVSFG